MDQAHKSAINATRRRNFFCALFLKLTKKTAPACLPKPLPNCFLLLCNKHLRPVVAVCNVPYANLCK